MTAAEQLTPRRCVERALHGGRSARVPFTMYEYRVLPCVAERRMRNRGMCIVNRSFTGFNTHRPNVNTTQHVYWDKGTQLVRTSHETPVGTLTTLNQPQAFTSWRHEQMFKSPEDYKALLFFIQDEQYEPAYKAFVEAEAACGEDAIFRAQIGLEPMQQLISGGLIAMQDFALEWMDHRDEILKLYHALVENRRKVYPLVAESPALHANYGGNVVPALVSVDMFEQYYVPHYQEAAEIMHRHGKLIGCHFDGNCRLLSEAIGATDLDYIEAFTPAPDTDMTVADAHAAWPGKVLWLNFPSSQHLATDARVRALTVELLDQAGVVDGLIMGITEDIPPDRWQGSCLAIMDGLERHAEAHPQRYG